jgi:hypothetical protein
VGNLRTAASYAEAGCLVKPLLLRFFQDEKVEFDFRVRSVSIRTRPPDGWFHSSAHPGLSEDQLVAYLKGGSSPWRPDYVTTMSMLFGTVVHGVVQSALDQMKVTVPLPPGGCVACGLPRSGRGLTCREHGAVDVSTRSRGHLDGILSLGEHGTRGLDIKTIKMWGSYGLKDAPDMDLGFFIRNWLKYYAQVQDYMRLTGLRNFIVFFMALGNPWEMREYHVPWDPEFALGIEVRYRRALARAGIQ